MTRNILELNVGDGPYLAKATLQVLLTRMFRETPDVDLVRLDGRM